MGPAQISHPSVALLDDRGVVRVAGEDAAKLLQGVISNDMDLLAKQPAMHAALLTPQGKILFDFFVVNAGDAGFLLETGRDQVAGLIRRLAMYKLRAKAAITDVSDDYRVLAVWGPWRQKQEAMTGALWFSDPRLPALGWRILAPAQLASTIASASPGGTRAAADYHAHRIAQGVPQAGEDYDLGDAFPHEANFDQLNGVCFAKGCFVGQEVVSRMQHRASARKRIVPVAGERALQSGSEILAGTAVIGRIGSVADNHALALIRLDRAAQAKTNGDALVAGEVTIALRKPSWASVDLLQGAAAEGT
jgi:folate-binding protein YgfZ